MFRRSLAPSRSLTVDWMALAGQLAAGGPAAIILIILLGFGGVISGKVRLPREFNREVEARKLAEVERDRFRTEAENLRVERNLEHEQKIRTLELLNATLAGRRQQQGGSDVGADP